MFLYFSLFFTLSFGSFLSAFFFSFFFAYTDWIQIGYRLDTDWIHYVYTMDTKCIHSLKVSIYAAYSCFGNRMETKRQPKKNPSFSARAKFLKL